VVPWYHRSSWMGRSPEVRVHRTEGRVPLGVRDVSILCIRLYCSGVSELRKTSWSAPPNVWLWMGGHLRVTPHLGHLLFRRAGGMPVGLRCQQCVNADEGIEAYGLDRSQRGCD
jgi:hypothetical protein